MEILTTKTTKMNIQGFKKGENVVRVESAKGSGDRSYMGECMTFLGVANGCAYFDRMDNSIMSEITGNTRISLRLDWWSEGWEPWIDIDDVNVENTSVKYNLKSEIKKAISNEDYELIAELKSILDNALVSIK